MTETRPLSHYKPELRYTPNVKYLRIIRTLICSPAGRLLPLRQAGEEHVTFDRAQSDGPGPVPAAGSGETRRALPLGFTVTGTPALARGLKATFRSGQFQSHSLTCAVFSNKEVLLVSSATCH